jgi:BNR repeat-like domain
MQRARLRIAALAGSLAAFMALGPASAGPFTPQDLVTVSGASPIAKCEGDTGFRDVGGVPAKQFVDSEVEPHVMVDPSNSDVIIGAWQQDRWNNGGAEGNITATSLDGGETWTVNPVTKSSNCTGGTAANGGNWERASDPWVAISPDGTAYLMSLVTNTVQGGFDTNPDDMIVSRSTNQGATWEDPISLNRDESQNSFNDKNAITADPNDSDFVYAVWDLVVSPPSGNESQEAFENSRAFTGDIYFARTTDGGENWEPGRKIYKAGTIAQTIGNQIGVLPVNEEFNGELVNVFTLFRGATNKQGTRGFHIAVIRSADHGETWDREETIVDRFFRGVVIDPDSPLPPGVEARHRTGDINAEIAVDRETGAVYLVWQDSRFGPRSSIAFSQSLDGGLTWSTPIKVNQTPDLPNNLNEQAFLPMVHVLDDGTVAVTYYDFRSNTANKGATTPTEAFISHCHPDSEDCSVAAGWGDEVPLTDEPFDSRRAPVARGFFLGDYVGLGQSGDAFHPFFTVTTKSDPANIVTREVVPQAAP